MCWQDRYAVEQLSGSFGDRSADAFDTTQAHVPDRETSGTLDCSDSGCAQLLPERTSCGTLAPVLH